MRALLDDQAARRDCLADVLAEATDWAIATPRDVNEEFEWMAAHGEAKEFCFCLQALVTSRFCARMSIFTRPTASTASMSRCVVGYPQVCPVEPMDKKSRFLGRTMTKETWCELCSEELLLVRAGSGEGALELTDVGVWRSARAESELVMSRKVSSSVFKPAGSAGDGKVQDSLSEVGWEDCAFHREEKHVTVGGRDRVSSGGTPKANVHDKIGHERVMAELSGFAFRNDGLGIKREVEGYRCDNACFFPFKGNLVASRRRTSKGQDRYGSQQEAGFEEVLFYFHKFSIVECFVS
jgi:hypothetical protein